MSTERFANSAQTTLASGIDNAVTTLAVASSGTFPTSGNFRVRVDNELMLVTAVSGTTWTVTRQVESTTAAAHSSGATVTQVLTAGVMNTLAVITADQTANTIMAGPGSGGAAAPAFRALVAADVAGRVVPASLQSTGWSSVSAYRSTNQSLTQNAFNTISFDTEVTDPDGEFATTTFTPTNTGTYLVNFGAVVGGATGRTIAAVRQSTTVVATVADGTLVFAGGTVVVDLTGSTAYTFAVYPTDAGTTAQGGSGSTYVKIRRLY